MKKFKRGTYYIQKADKIVILAPSYEIVFILDKEEDYWSYWIYKNDLIKNNPIYIGEEP